MTNPVEPHVGPWTVEDLLALPDDCYRREIIEGVLYVTPPHVWRHVEVSAYLERTILRALPPGYDAFDGGAGIACGSSFLIPDLVVVGGRPAVPRPWLEPSDVVLAVEVESPSSRRTDRIRKPRVFAQHAVPAYWRVETGDALTIVAYRLVDGSYVEAARASGDEVLTVDEPFPVRLRPSDLGRRPEAIRSGPS